MSGAGGAAAGRGRGLRQHLGDLHAQRRALPRASSSSPAPTPCPRPRRARAAEFGLRAVTVEELATDPAVDLVLNLTVPVGAFRRDDGGARRPASTSSPRSRSPPRSRTGRAARRRGRARAGLALGSAPDTFLGAAGRRARQLIDEGAIGRPVAGTAFMLGRGMEHWHPNPQFYYQPGGGPVLDMGPYYLTMLVNLLGPVARVMAMTGRGQAERLVTAEGPVPRHALPGRHARPRRWRSSSSARGATVTFGASWDVFRHSNHPIELHGTEGSLRLPDPDTFGGTVSLSARGAEWQETSTAKARSTARRTGPTPRPTGPTTACSGSPISPPRSRAGRRAARVRRARPPRARGAGGDPRRGRPPRAGRDRGRGRPPGAALRGGSRGVSGRLRSRRLGAVTIVVIAGRC